MVSPSHSDSPSHGLRSLPAPLIPPPAVNGLSPFPPRPAMVGAGAASFWSFPSGVGGGGGAGSGARRDPDPAPGGTGGGRGDTRGHWERSGPFPAPVLDGRCRNVRGPPWLSLGGASVPLPGPAAQPPVGAGRDRAVTGGSVPVHDPVTDTRPYGLGQPRGPVRAPPESLVPGAVPLFALSPLHGPVPAARPRARPRGENLPGPGVCHRCHLLGTGVRARGGVGGAPWRAEELGGPERLPGVAALPFPQSRGKLRARGYPRGSEPAVGPCWHPGLFPLFPGVGKAPGFHRLLEEKQRRDHPGA